MFFGSFSQSCSVLTLFFSTFSSFTSLAGGVIIMVPVSLVFSFSKCCRLFLVNLLFLAAIAAWEGSRRATTLLFFRFLGGDLSSLVSIPRLRSA